MGDVIHLHARTSAGALKPKTVGSARCCSRRSRAAEKARKCSGGIEPRDFQLLTADVPTHTKAAAAEGPPTAVTIASTDLSIPYCSSRTVNLSTLHTSAVDCGGVVRFNLAMRESLKSLGNRLTVTREALGLSAAELCKRIDCKPNRWSQYESGERKITLEIADRLCDEFGLSLDWIYRANRAMLPDNIRVKIPRIAA